MQGFEQVVEILHAAEYGLDGVVIRHIVTEIMHRRCVDGREPNRIDAEAFKIVNLFENALEVADAVAVGVFEATRINLIDNRFFVP